MLVLDLALCAPRREVGAYASFKKLEIGSWVWQRQQQRLKNKLASPPQNKSTLRSNTEQNLSLSWLAIFSTNKFEGALSSDRTKDCRRRTKT
jgi:hypothetical protein